VKKFSPRWPRDDSKKQMKKRTRKDMKFNAILNIPEPDEGNSLLIPQVAGYHRSV
jgi:hypothetical protein